MKVCDIFHPVCFQIPRQNAEYYILNTILFLCTAFRMDTLDPALMCVCDILECVVMYV